MTTRQRRQTPLLLRREVAGTSTKGRMPLLASFAPIAYFPSFHERYIISQGTGEYLIRAMGRGMESEPTLQRKQSCSFGRHCPNCEVRLAWCRPAILFEFIGCGVAQQKSERRGAKGHCAHLQLRTPSTVSGTGRAVPSMPLPCVL